MCAFAGLMHQQLEVSMCTCQLSVHNFYYHDYCYDYSYDYLYYDYCYRLILPYHIYVALGASHCFTPWRLGMS